MKLLRLCTIRVIRYHTDFGHELREILPEFNRDQNARNIMSNIISDLDAQEEAPYCIWLPQTVSEGTYRELALLHPSMSYHVGVAGYTELCKELDILPEVHIAEEARERGSTPIFEDIMSKPVKYNIMNDYTRSIDIVDPQPAHLNGDTAVRSMLEIRQAFGVPDVPQEEYSDGEDVYGLFESPGFDDKMFNITEDMNVDEYDSDIAAARRSNYDFARLMYEPLPLELPLVDKELLIVMVVYYGDIDRYARPRRPKMVKNKIQCCVRGIYHNTMFAKWWSKQTLSGYTALKTAIDARFIMNNVLSGDRSGDHNLPYLIWYPTLARPSTYRALSKLQSQTKSPVVRACIVADYQDLFDELIEEVTLDEALVAEAAGSVYRH